MIKLTLLGTTLTAFYNQPTYTLLLAILAVFISHLIITMSEKETALESNYIDEISSKDIEIKCQPLDFTNYTYREVQSFCKSINIPKVNRKRVVLEKELLSFCN